jgi:Pyridoxamine 5'-phosphate oxidase
MGMTDIDPTETTNLDSYGHDALEWSRARDLLESNPAGEDTPYFLGTVRPDGRPHSAGVGAVWHDGDVYVVSGPQTRKSRNLAENPACTISASLPGMDVVLEGEAERVTDRGVLERLASRYRELGWPVEVDGDAFTAPYSAPSAGPPPWYLYRVAVHTAFGVASAEPHGATRWRFDR